MTPKEKKFEEEFNPPATAEELRQAERALEVSIPADIKALYLDYNGIPEYRTSHLPFHLMPLTEMIELNQSIRGNANTPGLIRKYSLVYFWSDDESNCASVFTDGPFKDAISFLDHAGYYTGDCSPLFRDLGSFTNRVIELAERNLLIHQFDEGELDERELKKQIKKFPYQHYAWNDTASWHAMPVDYPISNASTTPCANDLARFEAAKKALDDEQFTVEDEREFLVFSLARLTPYNQAASLTKYLQENHPHIPSRVCNTLYLRDYDAAIPEIVTLAIAGNQNCRTSAEMTLAKFALGDVNKHMEAIKKEYAAQGGDLIQFMNTVRNFKSSPSLFYQW